MAMQHASEWDRDAALTTARILLEIKAVNFRPEEPYTFTSGWKSPVYIDCRRIIFFPRARRTICDLAAGRLGGSSRAAIFSDAHRSSALTPEVAEHADLILTAERLHRSAVARVAPLARARTFTLKEALVLVSVLTDEVRSGRSPRPGTLAEVAEALHDVRGSIPLIEPPMHTNVFHRDRALPKADPLALVVGHQDATLHRHATDEAYQVALTLGSRLVDLTEARVARIGATPNDWWWRQQA